MIERDHYNAWRNHPATLFFRQFLIDWADKVRAHRNEIVEEHQHLGPEIVSALAEARGRLLQLEEMSDVSFKDIAEFYGVEEQDGAEAS